MTTSGERKCALLLMSLRGSDRRALLARLPIVSRNGIRTAIRELEAMHGASELVEDLLADKELGLAGLTPGTSLGVEELVELSEALSPAWFARVLVVCTGVDHRFCLALLDTKVASEVRPEAQRYPQLPPKLAEALLAEASALVHQRKAA